MLEGLISGADETTPFDHEVPAIEGRSGEVFIDGVDFEFLKRIDGGGAMLPHVPHDVVELASPEVVDGAGREPVLHVDVAHFPVLPLQLVFIQ